MTTNNPESNLLNLLKVNTTDHIIDQYLNAINTNWPGVQFIYHSKEAPKYVGDIIDLTTSNDNFGKIEIIYKNENVSDATKTLIRNSAELLAVLLENRKQIDQLNSEKAKLFKLIEVQTTKIQEVDLLKTSFVANLSHEIRTPLNGILGFAELLKKKDISSEKREMYADIIYNNGQQLLNIITDVIDLSKIYADQLIIEEKQVLLKQLLDHLQFIYQNELKRNEKSNIKLSINTHVENNDIIILTDGTRLQQIFQYLLSNAIKFTHTGEISFGFKIEKNKVVFHVKDTGIGITPEHKKFIFDHFRQANESISREYGGTGLGLAISKKLVELMGGEIWVESEVNIGTTFYFTLPLKKSLQDSVQDTPAQQDKHIPTFKGKQILLVEDDQTSYLLIKAVLEEIGAKITRVDNGLDSIQMCKDLNPDLVLMDIQLPKMNGYDAVKNIRLTQPNKIIIAITANAFEEDRQKCMAIGCNDFLAKPVSKDLLINTIAKYLEINQ
jgi:signal transduction histidine kinase/CheY-like chemotaxis protein